MSSLRSGMLAFGIALLVGCGGEGGEIPGELPKPQPIPASGSASLSIESAKRTVDIDGRRSASGAFAIVELTLTNRSFQHDLALTPSSFAIRMRDQSQRRAIRADLASFGTPCTSSLVAATGKTSTCFLAFEIPTGAWPIELSYQTAEASAITALGAAPALEKSGLSCDDISECRANCDTHACEDNCLGRGSSAGQAEWNTLDLCIAKACGEVRLPAASTSEPCAYDGSGHVYTQLECDTCRAAVVSDGGDCAVDQKACSK